MNSSGRRRELPICSDDGSQPVTARKPDWLRVHALGSRTSAKIRRILRKHGLDTVCNEALCPNRGHCYDRGTATFLIMGRVCTRSCAYCAIEKKPDGVEPLNPAEPVELASAAAELGLRYVVVTSVTRDDLPDGGAAHFALTVDALRERIPGVKIEILTPDFKGNRASLEKLASSPPDVFNHNLETVESLFPTLRPEASYSLSLRILNDFGKLAPGTVVKSGMMLGLGETEKEVRTALNDLLSAGVTMLTLGQYLQPGRENTPVVRYVPPREFDSWKDCALGLGFKSVASAPLVRSSFHADLTVHEG